MAETDVSPCVAVVIVSAVQEQQETLPLGGWGWEVLEKGEVSIGKEDKDGIARTFEIEPQTRILSSNRSFHSISSAQLITCLLVEDRTVLMGRHGTGSGTSISLPTGGICGSEHVLRHNLRVHAHCID